VVVRTRDLGAGILPRALVADASEARPTLAALAEAGADCVVLVPPEPDVPLDPDACASLLG